MRTVTLGKSRLSRLEIWWKKPLAYKARSIYDRVSSFPYSLLLNTLKSVPGSRWLFDSRLARALLFDMSAPDSFLMSYGRTETFLVAASDQIIGRSVFINRHPFDLEKLETAVALLGHHHTRSLLIDVGANIGTICIPAISRGLFERAIAIEPEPLNYSLLVANIALNKMIGKVTAHNVALGQIDDETVILELCKDNHGDHRIRMDAKTALFDEVTRDTIKTKSETLNRIAGDVDPASTLLWIDTQGFEGFVLSGASNALKKQTPICVEFWPYGMARSGCYSLLKEALVSHGYRSFFELGDPKTAVPLSHKSLDDLYKRLADPGAFTDLLIV